MFDDNHMEESDLMLRSILENGQEEVPAHIWEGVSGGLDKIAGRKTVVLWLGRAAAVAAAAAVAVGVFFGIGSDKPAVPEAVPDMIAVVENTENNLSRPEDILIADAGQLPSQNSYVAPSECRTTASDAEETHKNTTAETSAVTDAAPAPADEPAEESRTSVNETPTEYYETSDWAEKPERKKDRIRTSLVVSGIAGTNNPQNPGSIGPLKSTGIFKSPVKTTVEQTSSQTTYGIPLSVGAGVKLNFTRRWSLGMGFNYTLLTSKFNGKYTKVEDGVASLPISATIRNTQHYIGIPVNAYYSIINKDFINFYAYAGGTVEKCIANNYEVQTTPVINHEETVKGVQLSANAGIGVEFMLGQYVGIYIDPSLRYYFNGGQPKSIRTAQPLMLGFEMGLRFNL